MQLQLNTSGSGNVVQAADVGWVKVDGTTYSTSLLVSQDLLRTDWQVRSVGELDASLAHELLKLNPELLILGTGTQLIFPDREFLTTFAQHGVGCEVMDTLAACRTYNVLLSEGRAVLAALILGSPET